MEPRQLFQLIVIGVLALIVLGSMIDTAFYNTSAALTPNVTGVSATVLSLLGLIFLIVVFIGFTSWL
jgi:hypothetical protein